MSAGILLLLILTIYFINLSKKTAFTVEKTSGQDTAGEFAKSLDAATESTDVEVPSASPLDEALPDVNLIEEGNPFTKGYKNPFD